MRQADINRVNRAKQHLNAAITQLNSIQWIHVSNIEDSLKMRAKEMIGDADSILDDILNIQGK